MKNQTCCFTGHRDLPPQIQKRLAGGADNAPSARRDGFRRAGHGALI
ncbi:MAG: hypothetical protein UGF45_08265 [Massilioclostridium sp.]|nr:hypothetical protein [Massilioclostridium sp.]MEE1491992.1 hypothetical protein [Massilioclostridium sp.]